MPDRLLRDELLESDPWLDLPSDTARLAFIVLLLQVDDFGNAEAGERRLFRLLDKTAQVKTPETAATVLAQLCDADLIRIYETAGKRFLHLPKLRPHRQYLVRKCPPSPWDDDLLTGKGRKILEKLSAKPHSSTNQYVAENLVTIPLPSSNDVVTASQVGVGVGVGVGELLNPPVGPPKGGLPPGKPKKQKQKREAVTFDGWNTACREAGVKHIPETDAVWKFADDVGLPDDFVRLTWFAFRDRYRGEPKRYRDWPAVFRRAVKANWFRLWFLGEDGKYGLSSTGKVRLREMQAAKMARAGEATPSMQKIASPGFTGASL